MDRVAFRTEGGSAYVLDFNVDGIEVVRVSDHPIPGRPQRSATFAARYDSAEFQATAHGIRVHLRSHVDRTRNFTTSPVRDLVQLSTTGRTS